MLRGREVGILQYVLNYNRRFGLGNEKQFLVGILFLFLREKSFLQFCYNHARIKKKTPLFYTLNFVTMLKEKQSHLD